MRTENWYGHDIRFIEINGEWYAILKDICDALKLRTDKIASRLYPEMLMTFQGWLDLRLTPNISTNLSTELIAV